MALRLNQPEHIPLKHRKVLAPKLLYFENSLEKYDSHEALFQQTLIDSANKADGTSPDVQPLDEYLQKSLTSQINSFFPSYGSVKDPFYPFHSATMLLRCGECTNGREICCGDARDAQRVEEQGFCILPLKTMFACSLAVASHYYKTYSSGTPFEVRFHTTHTAASILNDIPAPYLVDGRTDISGNTSTVIITLNSQLFDRESYYSILYIMFHECICHAFQGSIDPKTSLRSSCGENDSFGEGWMDFAAREILQDTLQGLIDPDLSQSIRIPSFEGLPEVCDHLNAQRRNVRCRKPCATAVVNDAGFRTAEMVVNLLHELGVDDPWRTFYELTFRLNASETTEVARRWFMATALDSLEPYCRKRNRKPGTPSCAEYFEKYARTADLSALLSNFVPDEILRECKLDKRIMNNE